MADQFVEGVHIQGLEHCLKVVLIGPDVPVLEPVGMREMAHRKKRILVTECGGKYLVRRSAKNSAKVEIVR